jgi:hypothetical protein
MKEIPLHNRKGDVVAFALVDDDMYDFLMQWSWYKSVNGYPTRSARAPMHSIRMHNVILPPPSGYRVDHCNRNPLDNQKENLRIATAFGNAQNQKSREMTSSAFKGVHWQRVHNKWAARITANGQFHHIGLYVIETDAARAYDHYARQLHGEFAVLNFPNDPDIYPEPDHETPDLRGERCGHAKLTPEQIIAMRRCHDTEKPALSALASRFDTTKANAHRIVTRQTWKGAEYEPR